MYYIMQIMGMSDPDVSGLYLWDDDWRLVLPVPWQKLQSWPLAERYHPAGIQ